jgi:hypothetical protein
MNSKSKVFKNSHNNEVKSNNPMSKIWKKGETTTTKKPLGETLKEDTKSHLDILQVWKHIHMPNIFN